MTPFTTLERITDICGHRAVRLTVPGMENGIQRIEVEFENGLVVSVSESSIPGAWRAFFPRLAEALNLPASAISGLGKSPPR